MILINNRFTQTMEVHTKDECYFIPPKVHNYKLDVKMADVTEFNKKLVLREAPAPEPASETTVSPAPADEPEIEDEDGGE